MNPSSARSSKWRCRPTDTQSRAAIALSWRAQRSATPRYHFNQSLSLLSLAKCKNQLINALNDQPAKKPKLTPKQRKRLERLKVWWPDMYFSCWSPSLSLGISQLCSHTNVCAPNLFVVYSPHIWIWIFLCWSLGKAREEGEEERTFWVTLVSGTHTLPCFSLLSLSLSLSS